jgi:hypothetical protein|tara:strand:- start:201 stop:440 length:240 start_codon:yes stop_codon:yes gene_type:complete
MSLFDDMEQIMVLANDILGNEPRGDYEIVIMYRDPDVSQDWLTVSYRDMSISDIQSLPEITDGYEIGGMSVKKTRGLKG